MDKLSSGRWLRRRWKGWDRTNGLKFVLSLQSPSRQPGTRRAAAAVSQHNGPCGYTKTSSHALGPRLFPNPAGPETPPEKNLHVHDAASPSSRHSTLGLARWSAVRARWQCTHSLMLHAHGVGYPRLPWLGSRRGPMAGAASVWASCCVLLLRLRVPRAGISERAGIFTRRRRSHHRAARPHWRPSSRSCRRRHARCCWRAPARQLPAWRGRRVPCRKRNQKAAAAAWRARAPARILCSCSRFAAAAAQHSTHSHRGR